MAHPIEIIRSFTVLTPELESRLKSLMTERTYRRGETITGLSAITSLAYYIESGSARVYYTRSGREHTFSFSFEDEFIVPSRFLIEKNDDTIAIQFLEQTKAVSVSHSMVKDEMKSSGAVSVPEAMLFLNVAMMRYALDLEERISVLQYSSAEERYRWATTRYPRLLETASITQIASFLGVTKETLYRIRSGNY